MNPPPSSRDPWRWLPSPLLKGSVALHAAAGAALALQPRTWPLALGALVADHLVLSTVGLVPRGTLLGPNLTRLPASAGDCVALTIDDGPDPGVTPTVLRILADRGACATFFCVGEQLRAERGLAREIVAAGHAIENHTDSHPYTFSFYGPRAIAGEISRAQDTIGAIAGRRPRYFRAPAGLRNPFLQPVLSRLGLRLASWTRRGFDTVERDGAVVTRRLLRKLAAGDIVLLHDHRAARSAAGIPVILEVLPRLLDAFEEAGLRTVTLPDIAC